MSGGTVVVTGGAGFIGSHLVDRLLADGRRVVVVDDLSTGDAARLDPAADLEVLDFVDFERLRAVVSPAAPEAIFHLGAQAKVTVSVDDPARDLDVNVKGTMNVLRCAEEHSAPVVLTSTCAVYGDDAPMPTPETQIPSPMAPYGASKWAAESYLKAWSTPAAPHTACRLGNVYGPRQNPFGEAGVVAIISHKLWSGERATLFGHGKPVRDYVHVSDVVDALVRACGAGGTYNVSAGKAIPVSEIYDLLRDASGSDIEPELADLRPGEMEAALLDPSRAREELGWEATTPLAEGVAATYTALVAGFEAGTVPNES